MPIRCFVASAFGHDDVDEIFDKGIRPVARELGVKADRVDRVEHNEDIDDKIIALMESCDLCIADLTYARPSVYFEAGHVAGSGKPVIYTCRRDHFKAREDDPQGNFRVHFDLQMKNIIDWTKPNDTFRRRLTSRIKHVIRPLQKEQAAREAKSKSRAEFSALSTVARRQALGRSAWNLMVEKGYVAEMKQESFPFIGNGLVGVRRRTPPIDVYVVFPFQSITKKVLSRIANRGPLNVRLMIDAVTKGQSELRSVHILCLSLRSVPLSRVDEALPRFVPARVLRKAFSKFRDKNSGPEFTSVHILDSIQSVEEMLSQLEEHLAANEKYLVTLSSDA